MNVIFNFLYQFYFEFICLILGIILFFFWIISKEEFDESITQNITLKILKSLSNNGKKRLLYSSIFLILFSISIVIYKIIVKPNYSEWVSVVITVILSAYAVYIGIRMNIKTNNNLKQIDLRLGNMKELESQILDTTRKPLTSINEILYSCFELAKRANQGEPSKIWILAFTLGFGPAHAIPEIKKSWKESYKSHFSSDYEAFNGNLIDIFDSSTDVTVVSLKPDNIEDKFVRPLYLKDPYNKYKDEIQNKIDEINKLHKNVISPEEGEENKEDKKIHKKEVKIIPLQSLIIEYKDGADTKISAVVFHVGTENVSSPIVQGFYTDIPNMCNIFINLTESLLN